MKSSIKTPIEFYQFKKDLEDFLFIAKNYIDKWNTPAVITNFMIKQFGIITKKKLEKLLYKECDKLPKKYKENEEYKENRKVINHNIRKVLDNIASDEVLLLHTTYSFNISRKNRGFGNDYFFIKDLVKGRIYVINYNYSYDIDCHNEEIELDYADGIAYIGKY